MKATETDGSHIIYGSWDDTSNNQILVYFHPNGLDTTLFFMDGFDYGGGIDVYFEIRNPKEIDRILHQENKDDYQIKQELLNFCKGEIK